MKYISIGSPRLGFYHEIGDARCIVAHVKLLYVTSHTSRVNTPEIEKTDIFKLKKENKSLIP